MSLVVFPIERAGERRLDNVLLEAATRLALSADLRSSREGSSAEPYRVLVPGTSIDEARFRGPGRRFILPLDADAREDTSADDPFGDPELGLREVIEEALNSASTLRGASAAAERGSAMAVLVPVLVLPEVKVAAQRTALFEEMQRRLQSLWERLEAIVPQLVGGGMVENARLSQENIRVVPWVFAEEPIKGDSIPAIFKGPKGLGCPALTPIVYGDVSRLQASQKFETYGSARLLTDLLLLHALSANVSEYQAVLEGGGAAFAEAGRTILSMHSALFEFPFEDMVRASVLKRIAGNSAEERLVPDLAGIGELSNLMRPEVGDTVTSLVERIRQILVQDEFKPGTYQFGRTRDLGADTVDANVPAISFDLAPSMDEIRGLSALRRTDRLHTRFLDLLSEATGRPLERAISRSLDSTRTILDQETEVLEKQLETSFDWRPGSGQASGESPGVRAMGRVLSTIDGVRDALDEIDQSNRSRQVASLQEILSSAKALRAGWIDREEALVQQAATIPAPKARLLHLAGLGVAILLLSYLLLTIHGFFSGLSIWLQRFLPLVFAGAGVGMAAYFQHRRVQAYLQSWESLSNALAGEANEAGRKLENLLNQRLREIKMAATNDLRRSLEGARQRFVTELGGVSSLVTDELAVRAMQAREAEDALRTSPEVVGRFRVALQEDAAGRQVSPEGFHARLRESFQGVISLTQIPRRISLGEHRALIQAVVDASRPMAGEARLTDGSRVLDVLRQAIRYGADANRLSMKPGANAPVRRVLLASTLVGKSQLAVRSLKADFADVHFMDERGAAASNLAGETVIVAVVETSWLSDGSIIGRPAEQGSSQSADPEAHPAGLPGDR